MKNRIYQFMYGRYGKDELYKFLLIVYFILLVLNIFIKSSIVNTIELFIAIIVLIRFFSKNYVLRRKENNIYLKIRNTIIKPFKNIKRNYKDRYSCVYKRCHKCHGTLRLPIPNERGIKKVKCPNCSHLNKFFILRKVKIEIVRK